MRALFRKLRRARFAYEPLINVLVYRKRLERNYESFKTSLGKQKPACEVAPVLKSNAYGHGLVPVAHIFDRLGAPFMVIDSFYEALVLRNEHVRSPLLVMGYTPLSNVKLKRLQDVRFVLMGIEQVQEIAEGLHVPRRFHLKIDTGMHRQGVPLDQLDRALSLIKSNSKVQLEGVCTHLADADGPDELFTHKQIRTWNDVVAKVSGAFPDIKYKHVAATAGTTFSSSIDANVARVGLGMYGLTTSPRAGGPGAPVLEPALALTTRVTSLRTLQPGERVGYNVTFTAKRVSKIATIPVGYFEGLDRRLSSIGVVEVRGTLCPIAGRVSMNICSIDVTDLPDVAVGDPVTVYSADPGKPNSIAQAAATAHAIPYDLLVHIAPHLRRTIV